MVFYIFIQFKKGKREGQGIQSSLKGCREKRLFKGHHFLMESIRKRTPFAIKNGIYIGNGFIPGEVAPRIKLCLIGIPCR